MSTAVQPVSASLVYLPEGVARVYDGWGYTAAPGSPNSPAGAYRPGRTWRLESQRHRQDLVMRDLRTRSTRLSEGIRLYVIPDRGSLGLYRRAESSAPDRFIASVTDGYAESLHHVQVESLAQAQVNSGRRLDGAGTPSWDAGDYTFQLTVGSDTHDVTVSIVKSGTGADTNEDLLHKIGRQVTAADDRLEYEVKEIEVPDENGLAVKNSYLVVRSRTTGRGTTFSMTDTTGSLMTDLGLDRASPTAAPAFLEFDHLDFNSSGNTGISIAGELFMSLFGATGPETLNVQAGFDALVDQTEQLLWYYNDYVDFLNQNRADVKPVIANRIRAEMDEDQRRMIEIGLSPQRIGRLGLTGLFERALLGMPERVREVLTGPEGFFTGVKGVLEDVLSRDLHHYARRLTGPLTGYSSSAKLFRKLQTGLFLSAIA